MTWGRGWEVAANREIEMQVRAAMRTDALRQVKPEQLRPAYLQKRCTCGSGLGDGLCTNCWPQ
jgi:hypothetical protein